jgi:hypothetical protein
MRTAICRAVWSYEYRTARAGLICGLRAVRKYIQAERREALVKSARRLGDTSKPTVL